MAKTQFIPKCPESESEANSEDENEKPDPRNDLEKYKEILVLVIVRNTYSSMMWILTNSK